MIHYTKNEPYNRPPYYTAIVNSECIGTLEQEVDGYYYWLPKPLNGTAVASWILKDLYMKLEALNEAWDQKIAGALKKSPQGAPFDEDLQAHD